MKELKRFTLKILSEFVLFACPIFIAQSFAQTNPDSLHIIDKHIPINPKLWALHSIEYSHLSSVDTIIIEPGNSKKFSESKYCPWDPTNYTFSYDLPDFMTFDDLGVSEDWFMDNFYTIKFRIAVSDTAPLGAFPVEIRYVLTAPPPNLVYCPATFSYVISTGPSGPPPPPPPPPISFEKHTIDENFINVTSVSATDIDKDGDIDILGAGNEFSWWENDGEEIFSKHTISEDTTYLAIVLDIDSDGDEDLVSSNIYKIVLWENNGLQNFTQKIIDNDDSTFLLSINVSKIDNNDRIDILGAGSEIVWWENNKSGNYIKHTIDDLKLSDSLSFISTSIHPVDVDGDGDIDIVGNIYGVEDTPEALYLEIGQLVWWENSGEGEFTKHIIVENTYIITVYSGEIYGDGEEDIISSSYENETVWWEYINSENFIKHSISDKRVWSVDILDFDNDGDIDIVGASYLSSTIVLWENVYSGNFIERQVEENFLGASSVDAIDLDSDGDIDILGSAETDNEIAWWENKFNEISIITHKKYNLIQVFNLHQNYPNPFNPTTSIDFDLPKTSEVTLKIFNVLGEEMTTLVSDRLSAGNYSYEWDASNMASGIYLYRLKAGDFVETKEMILMR
jgi:hypothetical protein